MSLPFFYVLSFLNSQLWVVRDHHESKSLKNVKSIIGKHRMEFENLLKLGIRLVNFLS